MYRDREIMISQSERGLRVALPWRWWILRSLRVTFPNSRPASELWTYEVPGVLAARRIEHWLSEVQLRIAADDRRRAWAVSDAEWESAGRAAQPPSRPLAEEEPPEPIVLRVPPVATTRATLALIAALEAGEVLIVSAESGIGRIYTLQPSNRPVRTEIAERAIREQFIRPACDGLFGPDTSQTWVAA